MTNKKRVIVYLIMLFLGTSIKPLVAATNLSPLTAEMVKNVVLCWYEGTNDHKPPGNLLALLTDDVEMRYPYIEKPFTGKEAFSAWYADVLMKYFDETHNVESWDIKVDGQLAKVAVVVRWERRAWKPGEATSHYEAFISHQRLELVRSPVDGSIRIQKKVVESFEKTAPVYNPES